MIRGIHIAVVVRIFAHTSCCIIRRERLANWLKDDVSRTANAPALEMLAEFTRRVIPPTSIENAKDVFMRILKKVGDILEAQIAEEGGSGAQTRSEREHYRIIVDKVEKIMTAHKEL
jgi:hypothetical protein